jgi:hypothetical protein
MCVCVCVCVCVDAVIKRLLNTNHNLFSDKFICIYLLIFHAEVLKRRSVRMKLCCVRVSLRGPSRVTGSSSPHYGTVVETFSSLLMGEITNSQATSWSRNLKNSFLISWIIYESGPCAMQGQCATRMMATEFCHVPLWANQLQSLAVRSLG